MGRGGKGHGKGKKGKSTSNMFFDSATDISSESASDWMEENLSMEQEQAGKSKKYEKQPQESAAGTSEKISTRATRRGKRGGGKGSNKKVEGEAEKVEEGSDPETEFEEPGQRCYWFSCDKPSRPGSKYCSDACGIALAKYRIMRILPGRIQQRMATPCRAQEKNEEELKEIRQEQEIVKGYLMELRMRLNSLEQFFKDISLLEYVPGVEDENTCMDDGSVACVICGHPTSAKNYMKHIDRCYNRMEKSVSFDGFLPSTGEVAKEIICDAYNSETKKYCKRMKVLCPEHKKGKTIPERKICGAPLKDEPSISTICKAPYKVCSRHYGWEKLRLVEIDGQRLNLLSKFEALMAREQQIRQEMTNRGGLLGLLLHSTTAEGDTRVVNSDSDNYYPTFDTPSSSTSFSSDN